MKERKEASQLRFTRNQILGIIVVIFGINLFLKIIGIGADLFWPVFLRWQVIGCTHDPNVGSVQFPIFLPAFSS